MFKITDKASAQAWLETQDHQTQIWFAARSALRTILFTGPVYEEDVARLSLNAFRALLVSASAATCPFAQIKALRRAAVNAADAVDTARADISRAHSASYVAGGAAHAAGAVDPSAASSSAAVAAEYAAAADVSGGRAYMSPADSSPDPRYDPPVCLYADAPLDAEAPAQWGPLWPGGDLPGAMAQIWDNLEASFDKDPEVWGFWEEWYSRILEGDPLPWDLSFRIATELTDEDWAISPDWHICARHVAKRIKEIRADWLASRPSQNSDFSQFVPESAAKVIVFPQTAVASFDGLSTTITHQFDLFRTEAGLPNDTPDALKPLEALPGILQSCVRLVETHSSSTSNEDALRQEIGRLRGTIDELRTRLEEEKDEHRRCRSDLADAQAKLEAAQRTIWQKAASSTVLGSAVLGSLVSALYIISDDAFDGAQRIENTIEELAEIRQLFAGEPMQASLIPPNRSESLD